MDVIHGHDQRHRRSTITRTVTTRCANTRARMHVSLRTTGWHLTCVKCHAFLMRESEDPRFTIVQWNPAPRHPEYTELSRFIVGQLLTESLRVTRGVETEWISSSSSSNTITERKRACAWTGYLPLGAHRIRTETIALEHRVPSSSERV